MFLNSSPILAQDGDIALNQQIWPDINATINTKVSSSSVSLASPDLNLVPCEVELNTLPGRLPLNTPSPDKAAYKVMEAFN